MIALSIIPATADPTLPMLIPPIFSMPFVEVVSASTVWVDFIALASQILPFLAVPCGPLV